MAEEQALVAGVEALSVAALPNLPLPRELRDQIWGYLLYHKNVHAKPYHDRSVAEYGTTSQKNQRSVSSAHTYKFHPATLAVNRQINSEATKVLESNQFVVVSFKSPLQGHEKHILSVPIITENPVHVARFKHHVLRVHVQGSKAMAKSFADVVSTQQMDCFCIVGSDLPLFCDMMQRYFLECAPSTNLVASTYGVANALRPVVKDSPAVDRNGLFQTTIRIHKKELSCDAVWKLLQPFGGMIHGGQQVIIKDYDESLTTKVASLKSRMGPKTVWVSALGWNLLGKVKYDQLLGRKLVESGRLDSAGLIYSRISDLSNSIWIFDLPDEMYQSEGSLPFALLCLAILDGLFMEATLWIRRANSKTNERFEKLVDSVPIMMDFFYILPAETKEKVSSNAMGGTLTGEILPAAIGRTAWLLALAALITKGGPRLKNTMPGLRHFHGILQGDENFEHDLKFFETLASDRDLRKKYQGDGAFTYDILENVSARELPIKIYDMATSNDYHPTPDGIEGWVDTVQLNKLRLEHPKEAAKLHTMP